jgi:long-chain acyl-CoA synthetase
VRPGDRVAIAMRNYPEWVLSFTAITSVGAVAVAMNAHWSAEELAYGLADSGAGVLLADAERLERLAASPPLPGLQVLAVRTDRLPPGVRALQALVDAVGDAVGDALGEVAMPQADIAPDDLAIMLYTSGSTGHPKGVPSSHRNVLAALLSWELDRTISELVAGVTPPPPAEQPGTLLAVPLFHVTGSHASYLASYRAQRRMVCMYRWDPELAARSAAQERLTSVVAPAAVTGDLVRVAQAGQHDLSSLVVVGGGGAPRAPEQVRQISTSFGQAMPNIGWGMTETNAIGTGNAGADYLGRPASSGRCSLLLDIRVVDELGQPLPAGQRGELQVRGTAVFAGYWNLPEANRQAFAEDGWFRTGDVAMLDDEGFLFIVDRLKDLIIRGGENIGCGQVESALLMHPQVHEAAVYAVPDDRLGEEVGATVHGDPGLDPDQLLAFLAQHLARFELPRYLLVSDQPLLRTPSGKILKRQIRTQALAELQRQGRLPP